MSQSAPNFTIARCCRNCKFFAPHRNKIDGVCDLDPDNQWDVHVTTVCDAHIWKSANKWLQKIQDEYGAAIP